MKLNADRRMWKAECGIHSLRSRCAHHKTHATSVSSFEFRVSSKKSPLATRNSQLAPSSGVTLIELLIAIAIIATLSAVFLGASRSAMESARAARTKTTISKLHTLLMEHYASYMTRRVDVNEPPGANPSQQDRQDLRLLATRAIMQMEMPDRWSDIIGNTVESTLPNVNAPRRTARSLPFPIGSYSVDVPAVTQIFFRRYNNMTSSNADTIRKNQGAECLYLVIMLMTGDGEARTLFSTQDIGDTDEDGAPEFLDGWGNPIEFLRWPAGFAASSSLMSGDPDADHDPFDPFRRDQLNSGSKVGFLNDAQSAYRLVPLIYSAGADGDLDIAAFPSDNVYFDPYLPVGAATILIGTRYDSEGGGDDNSADNIHNHLLDNR